MKKLINRKIILLSSTLIVLLITLVTVTVAWFQASVNVNADGADLTIADFDFKVSLTSGGAAVSDTDKIMLNVGTFTNVKPGSLAPGTEGKFDLYVTSNSEVTTGYQVMIDKTQLSLLVPAVDHASPDIDYSNILQKHIQFYVLNEDSEKMYIDDEHPATGALTNGVEKKVTINWEWPYEADVTDITDPDDKKNKIDTYDKEDTILGQNHDYISGKIKVVVKGIQYEPTP